MAKALVPKSVFVERDGLSIHSLVWDGAAGAPTLLLLHPNGFPAGFFEPLVARLGGRFRVVGVDLRGHGGSDAPPEAERYAYPEMARDVVAVLDHLGVERCAALGMSLGGAVAVLVDRERPGLVERMLLCEPVMIPLEFQPPEGGPQLRAEAARRRRAVWPDRATMVETYLTREGFAGIDRESMEAYARWGARDRDDGQVELCCPPEAEASVFLINRTPLGGLPAWDHLPQLQAKAVIVGGADSNLPEDVWRAQAARCGAELKIVTGGHFVVQEDLDRAAALVFEHLA